MLILLLLLLHFLLLFLVPDFIEVTCLFCCALHLFLLLMLCYLIERIKDTSWKHDVLICVRIAVQLMWGIFLLKGLWQSTLEIFTCSSWRGRSFTFGLMRGMLSWRWWLDWHSLGEWLIHACFISGIVSSRCGIKVDSGFVSEVLLLFG